MGRAAKQIEVMTLDEFFAVYDGVAEKYELVDGVPRVMAASKPDHAIIQSNALAPIAIDLCKLGGPCRAVPEAPIIFRNFGRDNFCVPDIVVDCTGKPSPGRSFENPLLIAEVLSPSNEKQTWDSIRAYATLPSLKEILVLESLKREAQVLRRLPDGSWGSEADMTKDHGAVTLKCLDLTIELSEMYAGTTLQ